MAQHRTAQPASALGFPSQSSSNSTSLPQSHEYLPPQANLPLTTPTSSKPSYTQLQKVITISLVTLAASLSSISSNIYFSILPTLSADFSISPTLINLTVTTYMVFQSLSPTLWGALSDSYGRRIIYLLTLTIYVGACTGLAESKTYYQLLILRAVQSTGSASTVALGAGVVGDVTSREERGGWMGIFQAGLLVPLAAGPVLGGGLAEALGWRSVFWALVIFGGGVLVAVSVFLPETLTGLRYGGRWYTLRPIGGCSRWQQAKKKDVEGGVAISQQGKEADKKVTLDFWTPLKLVGGGEVTCIILFISLYYTVWQMTITAISTLFESSYGLSSTQIGLTFIANGAGCIIGTILTGKFMDLDYIKVKTAYNGPDEDFPLEKARLRTVWIWSGMQIASTLVFGWTLNQKVHVSVPIICTFFLGWAATSTQSVVTTFLVDVFHGRSASATAALNMARCLMGAGGTAAILPIIKAIGTGWALTLWVGVMALGLVLVFVQMKWGVGWRRKREEREREEKLVREK
ncbi:MFS general substrate transporter [Lindgomyces ingoldianus]|uniref:MFS general substrate transporter n=1 Tax=Lindgomyces ingoldianus TaxID=673940 RepID=A0ACB6RAS1_9PLEO|nr:MFS general substrate transporter [Lindgomyces ingoldianus]KAF2476369.1 MFS general substrate transporter [Lindgomyces ingoldianus]